MKWDSLFFTGSNSRYWLILVDAVMVLVNNSGLSLSNNRIE